MPEPMNNRTLIQAFEGSVNTLDRLTDRTLTKSESHRAQMAIDALKEYGEASTRWARDSEKLATVLPKLEEANKGRAEQAVKLADTEKALAEANKELVKCGEMIKTLTTKLDQCNEKALQANEAQPVSIEG